MNKNMSKTIVITVLVAAVVSAVSIGMFGGSSPTVVEKVIEKIGAVSGPDTYFTYTANNDVKKYTQSVRINAASSTGACIFVTPPATTTLPVNGLTVNADNATGTNKW